MNVQRLRGLFAVTVVLVLALAACGDDGATTTTGGDDDGDTGSSGDAGSAEVIVQITVGGGFVTPTAALSTIPQLTILADGTVLSPGLVPLIYPGPALTPVQAGTVDQSAIDELVETARSLGLLEGPLDFGEPSISDAPTTTVTILADGVTHRLDAYALSFGGEVGGGGDTSASVGDDPAAANRQALADFVAAAEALAIGDHMWEPAAIVVTVIGPSQPDPSAPPQPALEWPLATEPTTAGNFPCTLVEGDDAATLAGALASATEASGWVIGDTTYSIAFRPLVPGDPGCP